MGMRKDFVILQCKGYKSLCMRGWDIYMKSLKDELEPVQGLFRHRSSLVQALSKRCSARSLCAVSFARDQPPCGALGGNAEYMYWLNVIALSCAKSDSTL